MLLKQRKTGEVRVGPALRGYRTYFRIVGQRVVQLIKVYQLAWSSTSSYMSSGGSSCFLRDLPTVSLILCFLMLIEVSAISALTHRRRKAA